MCHWPNYHLHLNTAKHGFSGVVKEQIGEWNGALLSSDESKFCLRIMDIYVFGVDLVSVIFLSAFAQGTLATPQASWCEGTISYNSRSHLVFLKGKVNSSRYIAQVVNPELLPFIR